MKIQQRSSTEIVKVKLSMLNMEAFSVAAGIVAICQLSRKVSFACLQVYHITACEDTKAVVHELFALQSVLKECRNLVISVDHRGEAQDRSEYLSATMRAKLQKLIGMSNAFLESAKQSMNPREYKEQSDTMALRLKCQDIGELLLRWKTYDRPILYFSAPSIMLIRSFRVLSEIKEARCFSHERTKELEIPNMTIRSLQTLEENAPKDHIPSPSTRMQHDYENTTENQRDAIAIVGMSCRYPGGAVDIQDFWGTLALGGKSPDTGGAERCLVRAHSVHWPELFHLGKESVFSLDDLSRVPPLRRFRMVTRITGRAVDDIQDLDPSVFGHKDTPCQKPVAIKPETSISSRFIAPLNLAGHYGKNVSGLVGEGNEKRHLRSTHPLLARNVRRQFLSRYASGLTTAVPTALLSGFSALCMHNSVANRLGKPALYSGHTSIIFSTVSRPSPPLVVVATFVHGISTLAYYYLRPTDTFREGFLGVGIVTASVLGLWSRIDVESLLLGVLPIVITGSLFFCTLMNVLVERFGRGICWRQSREFDLEKQTGI